MTLQFLGSQPYAEYSTRAGVFYADQNGVVSGVVSPIAAADLIASGAIPLAYHPIANFRNIIDGGDFSVNPWQRNVSGLATSGVIATAVSNTVTYFADRFFAVGGASSSILMAQVADTAIPGFSQSLKISRTSSNANTAAFNFGQIIETPDAIKCQGSPITLSFYAKAGANYSGGSLTASLVYGTGTNQSAANAVAASWTGQGNVFSQALTLTSGYQRYGATVNAGQLTGTVPSTAKQLGVLFQWTPSGTAGADDSVSIQGVQLEIGSQASPFEHRDVQVELEICQRYAWLINEPAAGVIVGVGGAAQAANAQVFYMATPVQLYIAPTVSVAAGSFKVCVGAAAAAATGFAAGSTHTPNAISVVSTLTQAAGGAATLQGGGGSGYILASSDF